MPGCFIGFTGLDSEFKMPLTEGTQLGPYEILAPIGVGGMGEVYRARDARLDRDVAVKILPSHLTSNSELKQRFDREAKAISSLTHPHICTIHDVGTEDGVDYLVMEYLQGQTLAERLAQGPLPIEQTLRIGTEISSALDRAHRAGVVHRDLKPGNIMLTKSGAKLLDFGLARHDTGAGLASAPDALTVSEPLTGKGTIVGTFQYMAPEQLEGKPADARTDLFALGAVLYEMATGHRAFEGESRASLIASIMSARPRSIAELQPMTPPALEHVVRMCLAKDPDDRIQTAHDVKLQLQWIAEGGSQIAAPAPVVARRKSRERLWILSSIILLSAVAVLAIAYLRLSRNPPRLIHAAIPAPEDARFVFTDDAGGPAVVSPNGRWIAFAARCADGINRLWVRSLEAASGRALTGTDWAYFPFWSPDSESIGYFADGKLLRISITGGFPVALCDARLGKGGTWLPDGTILFSPDFHEPIFSLPDAGGTPVAITSLDDANYTTHRWPVGLPDGKHFIYFAGNHDLAQRDTDAVFFASVDGTVNRKVIKARGNADYASGHLLYLRGSALMAQAFDAKQGILSGSPKPIAHDVQYDGAVWRSIFSASSAGVLLYQTGIAPSGTTLTWFDRAGKNLGNFGDQDIYAHILHFSPDGTRLLTPVGDPGDIWTFELDRGVRTRLTTETVDERPAIWSPDGNRIVYASRNRPDKKIVLFAKPSSGFGSAEPLHESEREMVPLDWSPDGEFLLVGTEEPEKPDGIFLLSLNGERKLEPLIDSEFRENFAQFSPDGRWIAYDSNESGRFEVYVVPFCPPTHDTSPESPCDRPGRWQLSTDGGFRPLWQRNGKELYFQTTNRDVYSVAIDASASGLKAEAPQRLFRPDAAVELSGQDSVGFAYDVTPDGERFLVNTFGSGDATPLTLVLNWTKLLESP